LVSKVTITNKDKLTEAGHIARRAVGRHAGGLINY